MPELLNLMFSFGARHFILDNQQFFVLKEPELPPVREGRIRALRGQIVLEVIGGPGANLDLRLIHPSERVHRNGLIQSIDADGVVRRGAAKPVALGWISDVS